MQKRSIDTTIVLLTVLVSVGCNTSGVPSHFPKLHPCTITILQDGQPLEGASVALAPDDKQQLSASAVTDANGVAKMMIQACYEGVPVGQYTVLVSKITRVENPNVSATPSMDGTSSMGDRNQQYITTYYTDPSYDDTKRSPLKIQITEGKNEQTFEVPKPK